MIQGRSFVTGGLNEKYKFTEKERDTETSYDYFGARFYDSELGRWLSVDPLAEKYPGWSPYNYTLNNPLKYIDPNGKWPEKIHNRILTTAFKDILSENQIKILQNASRFVDQDQSGSGSFKHAMRERGQNIENAKQKTNEFINQKQVEFINKDGDEALFALGEALHPIMDATSPSHEGFQSWDSNFLVSPTQINPLAIIEAIMHVYSESKIDDETLTTTVEKVREFYFESMEKKEDNEKETDQ